MELIQVECADCGKPVEVEPGVEKPYCEECWEVAGI